MKHDMTMAEALYRYKMGMELSPEVRQCVESRLFDAIHEEPRQYNSLSPRKLRINHKKPFHQ